MEKDGRVQGKIEVKYWPLRRTINQSVRLPLGCGFSNKLQISHEDTIKRTADFVLSHSLILFIYTLQQKLQLLL